MQEACEELLSTQESRQKPSIEATSIYRPRDWPTNEANAKPQMAQPYCGVKAVVTQAAWSLQLGSAMQAETALTVPSL